MSLLQRSVFFTTWVDGRWHPGEWGLQFYVLTWVSVGRFSHLDRSLDHRIRVMGGWVIWVWWMSRWYSGWHVGPGLWWGTADFCFSFRISTRAKLLCQIPLLHHSVSFTTWGDGRWRPDEEFDFGCRVGCRWWDYHRVWITCSQL